MDSWVDKRASIISGSNDITPDAYNQAQAEFDSGANLVKPEYVDPSVVLAARASEPPALPCFWYPSKIGCKHANECRRSHGVIGVATMFETLEERKGRIASELVSGVPLLDLSNLPELRKPCRYVKREGGCRKADECTFSHEPSPCKFFFTADGCPSGDSCNYSHKKQRCRHFFRSGGCRNAEKCGYSHELPGTVLKVKDCPFFPNGCANGPACAYNAVSSPCLAK